MKKIIPGLLMALLCTAAANAQLHVGARAGANITKMDNEAFAGHYRLGYAVGGYLYVNFMLFLGVQAEVMFNQSNTEVQSNLSGVYQNLIGGNKKLNYLSIPLLARINAGKILAFHIGPQFSILMNKDDNLLQNGKNAFKKGDFSGIVGAEVGLGSLKIYGRYILGFADIGKIGGDVKSRQIQAGLGFNIF